MSKKVFVSYCHKQGDWVFDQLVPCLKAGGAEVFINPERFKAPLDVIGQMDATQDAADMTVLILTPDYLSSDYCLHEMMRAIARDLQFTGAIIPVKREECEIPNEIKSVKLLWVNLMDDKDEAQWKLLLDTCGADLGAEAPHWLEARDEIIKNLQRNQSINLVVAGNPKWLEMINHIKCDLLPELGIVDLEKGSTVSRSGLVTELLKACGITRPVPIEPEDLIELDGALSARQLTQIALLRADHVSTRNYGIDLFSALRYLIMDSRKLVLLTESRRPFSELLPQDHPLSALDIKTVKLHGRLNQS